MPLGELNLPSWLAAPPIESAGTALARGAQAGSAISSSFMRAREQRLREQQFAEERGMRALQEQRLSQQLAIGGLALAQQTHDLEQTKNMALGRAKLSQVMSTIDWSSPADRAKVWGIGQQYPDLVPTIEAINEKFFLQSDRAATEAARWKSAAERGQTMLDIRQGQLDVAKGKLELAEESAADLSAYRRAQIDLAGARNEDERTYRQGLLDQARPKLKAGPAAVQPASRITALRDEAEAARAAGNTELYQQRMGEADMLQRSLDKGETITMTGPGGQQVTVSRGGRGGVPGAPTTGFQTQAQAKTVGFENAVAGISDILDKLKPGDVGVTGVIGENVFDKWVAQLYPAAERGQRVSNRAALRDLSEQLIGSVSADTSGRFSDADVRRLHAITSSVEAAHSYPEVVHRLQEMREILVDRTRVYAKGLGTPVPGFAQSRDEIVDAYRARHKALSQPLSEERLTREPFDAQIRSEADSTSEALRQYHGVNVNFQQ